MSVHKDQTLYEAFNRLIQAENESLPDEEALSSVTLSGPFQDRMETLLNRQKRGFYVLFGTAGRRVASVSVALLVAAMVTTVSVDALRESAVNFFVQAYEKFTVIQFVDDGNDPVQPTEIRQRIPTYVPESYAYAEEKSETDYYRRVFVQMDTGKQILFTQYWKDDGVWYINTKGSPYTQVTVRDMSGITTRNRGTTILVLADDTYTYTVSGPCPLEELLRMMESLEDRS